MKRVWLIFNPASRSVTDKMIAAIDATLAAAGVEVVGRSQFPDDDLPDPAMLGGVDTVIVAAGDGTINATAHRLDDWPGRLLVLPGGTMNMLPKALHGDADLAAIMAAAVEAPARPLPTVESAATGQGGGNRALVAALIGPAASWVHAREAVRKGRWHRMRRVVTLAYSKSLGQSVRVIEHGKRSNKYRAIFVAPEGGRLRVIKVSARGWRDGAALGWHWLRGDVTAARGATSELTDKLTLASTTPSFALFDGEPGHLPVGATLTPGTTRLQFVSTQ